MSSSRVRLVPLAVVVAGLSASVALAPVAGQAAKKKDTVKISITPSTGIKQGGKVAITVTGRASGLWQLQVLRSPYIGASTCRTGGGSAVLNAFRTPLLVQGAFRERRADAQIPETDFQYRPKDPKRPTPKRVYPNGGTWWYCAVLTAGGRSELKYRKAVDGVKIQIVDPKKVPLPTGGCRENPSRC